MSARWVCKLCRQHGLGGAEGWNRHHKAEHTDSSRYAAALSFGFAPNYSNGDRSRYDWRVPVPRIAAEPLDDTEGEGR